MKRLLNMCDKTPRSCYEMFNIKGKNRETTAIGGILTLFVDLVVLYIAIVKFMVMFSKNENSISSLW